MIDYEVAKPHVKRMEGLRDFPDGKPAAIRELIVALQCAESEEHARLTVDEFVQWGKNFCPSPAELRRALWQLRAPEEQPRPTVDALGRCPCHGWGMVGQPPNTRFCDCLAGGSLKRDVVTWNRMIWGPRKPDQTGREVAGMRKWTLEEWLAMVNALPRDGIGRAAMPRSFTTGLRDSLASGTRSGAARLRNRVREPGEDEDLVQ